LVSLHFNGHFAGKPRLADYIAARMMNDRSAGDNWSYKTCKAPVKSSPSTNRQPTIYRPDALPVAQPTVLKHRRPTLRSCSLTKFQIEIFSSSRSVRHAQRRQKRNWNWKSI